MSVKVSIILPVYNGEKYLRQTLNSVSNQVFSDYELIIVNDGSSDRSLQVMLEYAEKMDSIRIIDQKNTGVSSARNNALIVAKGELVCFMDADDVWHPEFLKRLVQVFNDSMVDLAFCDYQVFYNSCHFWDFPEKDTSRIKSEYGDQSFDYMMETGLGTALWNKMYRRELLMKYGILFNAESSYGEDMFFNWKASMVAKEIVYIQQPLYGYRLSNGAATTKYHPFLYEKYCSEYNSVLNFGRSNGCNLQQLNQSINLNLAQRLPSFLRMNIRNRIGFVKKYNYICFLCNENRVKRALEAWNKEKKEDSFLLRSMYKNKKMLVLVESMFLEFSFQIKRKINNLIQR